MSRSSATTATSLQKKQFEKCIGAAAITDAACQAANLAPIGTNAYQLVEFKPGDTVVYERNPNFRDAANVYFDKVVIKGGGDATSAARAVCETGEVDYAWNLQVQKAVLEPILAGGKCDAVAGGSFGVERIHLNFANPDPALGDKRSEPDQPHPFLSATCKVRQALCQGHRPPGHCRPALRPDRLTDLQYRRVARQRQLAEHHVRT